MSDAYEVVWAPSAIRDLDDILEYMTSQRGAEAAEELHADSTSLSRACSS